MKKSLMILASVALGSSMALAVNVESKNMVGFGQANVAADAFYMVGCSFQAMNSSNYVGIQELFPTNELYADPEDIAGSDQLYVYNGGLYTIYYFADLGNPGDPQWYDDGFAEPSAVVFNRGDAFWYKRVAASSATTLTISGQVPVDANYAHASIPVGYNMISGSYPNSSSLNDLGINAYTDTEDISGSDQIFVYDSGLYTIYYFADLGNPGDPQWYDDGFAEPTAAGLNVGQGAWYLRQANAVSAATWTEAKPY